MMTDRSERISMMCITPFEVNLPTAVAPNLQMSCGRWYQCVIFSAYVQYTRSTCMIQHAKPPFHALCFWWPGASRFKEVPKNNQVDHQCIFHDIINAQEIKVEAVNHVRTLRTIIRSGIQTQWLHFYFSRVHAYEPSCLGWHRKVYSKTSKKSWMNRGTR